MEPAPLEFFAAAQALWQQLEGARARHGDVHADTWRGLNVALRLVLHECVDEEHAPALSPTLAQCTGDCQRMLSVDNSNFRVDRHLKSGFKSKCKCRMSTKRPRLEPGGSSMEADALVCPDPTDADGPSIERCCETCTQLFVLDPEVYSVDVCRIPTAGLMYPDDTQPMSLHFYCPECLDDGHCGEFDSCADTPQDRRERAATDLRITLLSALRAASCSPSATR